MNSDDVPIYPVTAYNVGPVRHYGIVVLRPHYMPQGGTRPEDAQISRYYAFTLVQAEELVRSLQSAIQKVREWEREPMVGEIN